MSKQVKFNIVNPNGLHIKSLTILVNEANRFESECFITYNSKRVNLKSIMGVLSLEVPANGKVLIEIIGEDEQIAFVGITKVLKEQNLM